MLATSFLPSLWLSNLTIARSPTNTAACVCLLASRSTICAIVYNVVATYHWLTNKSSGNRFVFHIALPVN
uniref:Secreted protein n=1 Tax=Anguilla anguilla TaxID=7936 RepID=A0A0E9PUW8_ANGAN